MRTEKIDYAGSLGKISDGQFDKALRKLNLGGFIKAEKVTGGVVGQNVFLTSEKGEFVFRGNPFYEEQFAVEKFMVENLREHTNINTAHPYLIDDATDIFDWTYAIMPRLKGIQTMRGSEVIIELSKKERTKISRAMAAALAEMHSLTFEKVKNHQDINIFAFPHMTQVYPGYSERFMKNLKEAVSGLPEISVVTDEDNAYINKIIGENIDSLSVSFEPCFLMGDYKEDNVLFSNQKSENGENSEWKVCGVFDFAMSHFGDRESDLARIYAMYIDEDAALAKEFINEYIKLKPPREKFYERLKIYTLRERLGIWSWAKNAKIVWWDDDMPLKEWLSPYLDSR